MLTHASVAHLGLALCSRIGSVSSTCVGSWAQAEGQQLPQESSSHGEGRGGARGQAETHDGTLSLLLMFHGPKQ